MEPHPHPAVILDTFPDGRLLVVPFTTRADFRSVRERVAVSDTDDDFEVTGLRETSYLFPAGALLVGADDLVMANGYLTRDYVDELLELLSDPQIRSAVAERIRRDRQT